MKAQHLYAFLAKAWAELASPSLDQIYISAPKYLDSNAQATGDGRERGLVRSFI